MRMQKRQFRIGELAKHLNVQKFVIRFWEKEFALTTIRSGGGQRFYNEDDLRHFSMIKTLLYDQGFTIAGARKHLQDALPVELPSIPQSRATKPPKKQSPFDNDLIKELGELKQQLISLRELL